MCSSPYPVLEDSKRAHVEDVVEKLAVKPVEEPRADSPVKDVPEKPVDKPSLSLSSPALPLPQLSVWSGPVCL